MASPEESSAAAAAAPPPAEPAARVARGQRKRKRSGYEGPSSSSSAAESKISPIKWRTETQQKTYSTKLINALRRVRQASSAAEPPKSRTVREAADRALAVAAHGRTRWSRAILATWVRKLKARKRRPYAPRPISACSTAPADGEKKKRKKKNNNNKRKKEPELETKAKVLGRLVPGCRKLSFPTLLEEASDYIAALQMQVRAMTAIAEILAAAGSDSTAAANGGGDRRTERSGSSDPM